jgi:hypothetical protein
MPASSGMNCVPRPVDDDGLEVVPGAAVDVERHGVPAERPGDDGGEPCEHRLEVLGRPDAPRGLVGLAQGREQGQLGRCHRLLSGRRFARET